MATGAPRKSRSANGADEPGYPVTSVDSALRLLLLFAEREQLRIVEASRELDVARSTAHRLVKMLEYHGFVRQDPDSKAYTAGPVLVNLGLQVVRNLDVRTLARPLLESLVEETHETVNLAVLQGSEIVILDSVESPRSLRVGSRTGRIMPAFASASGRAILSQLDPERVRELFPEPRLPRLTPASITSWKQLEQELATTRARGYSVQRGEIESDVASVGAPVSNSRGKAGYALTVAVPAFRLDDDRIAEIGRAVVEHAEKLSAALQLNPSV